MNLHRAFLSIGSNKGNRLQYIKESINLTYLVE